MHFRFRSVASSLKPSSLYHKSSSANAEPLDQGFVCTLTHTPPPPRDIWQCLEIFWWVGGGQEFCCEYPTMHRTALHNKESPAKNDSNAKGEKVCPNERQNDVMPTPTKLSNYRGLKALHICLS